MRIKERLRHCWHELYYKLASPSAADFGMICKNVVEQIDLNDPPTTWRMWFRIKLHLSLCQACNYYFRASRALRKSVRAMAKGPGTSVDLEKINQELLKKYAKADKATDAKSKPH